MPTPAEAALAQLKRFGLSLPGTEPKSPWLGHDDVAVNNKTFAYLSTQDGHLAVSLKLPISAREALRLPDAAPAAYGLGGTEPTVTDANHFLCSCRCPERTPAYNTACPGCHTAYVTRTCGRRSMLAGP